MTWIDQWYPDTITALSEQRGSGGVDPSTGFRLPQTRPLDTIAILGLMAGTLEGSITRFMESEGFGTWAIRYGYTNSSGVIENQLEAALADTITIKEYLAGSGVPSSPWIRSKGATLTSELYELALAPTFLVSIEYNLYAEIKNAVAAWQRCVDAAAALITIGGANLTAPVSLATSVPFWKAVRQLCTSFDVLRENPPMSTLDKVRGATKAALTRTGEFAGEAAAHLADAAGKTAAAAAKGFFNEATMVSLMVAGIAIFVVLR